MNVSRTGALVALLLAVAAPAAAAQADPVAVVVRSTAGVQVQRGGARPAPVAAGLQLRAGDNVVVPQGGQAILLFRTGRSQTLTRSTRLPGTAAAPRGGVFRQTIRTLSEVATTDARTQPNRQGMIRPIDGAPVPVSPRNEVRVRSGRPRLTWLAVDSAAGYRVVLSRDGGGEVRSFDAGRDTAWTLPASEAPLTPGAAYQWSVATGDGGRAAPPQRFRVASRAAVDSVNAAMARLRAMGLNPGGDGLLLAAVVLRDAGFHYDALQALDRLAASGSATGRDFHLLRASVHDALGMLDRAAADFAAADGAAGP